MAAAAIVTLQVARRNILATHCDSQFLESGIDPFQFNHVHRTLARGEIVVHALLRAAFTLV